MIQIKAGRSERQYIAPDLKKAGKMDQPLSGHVVGLLPEHGYALLLLLENAQEIAVSRECLADGTFAGLHVGDRVWYFAEPGEGPHTKHTGRLVPIHDRYRAT